MEQKLNDNIIKIQNKNENIIKIQNKYDIMMMIMRVFQYQDAKYILALNA